MTLAGIPWRYYQLYLVTEILQSNYPITKRESEGSVEIDVGVGCGAVGCKGCGEVW